MDGKKKHKISGWALVVVLSLAFLVVWGNRIEPRRLDITRHSLQIEELSTEEPIKLAFFSDFQVGMWLGNEDFIPDIIERIKDEKPDAVLIGGDFIYHPTEEEPKEAEEEWDQDDLEHTKKLINQITNKLRPLIEAKIPVYAVLGNHDYSMSHSSAKMVEEAALYLETRLEEKGIKVLQNESVLLEKKSSQLYLVGIAPHYPDLDNVEQALSTVPPDAPRVLFMHNSNSLLEVSADKFDLAIAGHTHGGQVRIPGLPAWSWMSLVPQTRDEIKGDGWIRGFKGQDRLLYINRGIGFSSFPLRINCPPEVSIFTLKGS